MSERFTKCSGDHDNQMKYIAGISISQTAFIQSSTFSINSVGKIRNSPTWKQKSTITSPAISQIPVWITRRSSTRVSWCNDKKKKERVNLRYLYIVRTRTHTRSHVLSILQMFPGAQSSGNTTLQDYLYLRINFLVSCNYVRSEADTAASPHTGTRYNHPLGLRH